VFPDTIESDRRDYFEHIFNPEINLEALLRYYIGYHGAIFQDQRNHLIERVKRLLVDEQLRASADSLFGPNDELSRVFMAAHFPQLERLYFKAAGHERFSAVEVLPATVNTHQDKTFPHPLNQRSRPAWRAPLTAYVGQGGCLMVGPNQFQYFDPLERVYFPAASLRSYSQDVLRYERLTMRGPVMLIQDYGDGSNFAHFAFDWLTRLMHGIESGLADPRSCTFVMGGRRTAFQETMVEGLFSRYGLNWDNFLFPPKRMVLELKDKFTFFSDHNLIPLHPAQMGHPRSVEMLRRLAHQVSSAGDAAEGDLTAGAPGVGERIYISRDDAALRRVANEAEISAIARDAGFAIIRMSDYSLAEQIAVMRGARYVIGPHGMGLTHMIFNRGPLGILELFHPTLGTDAYAMMSRAMGFDYHWMLGEAIGDHKASYRIDPAEFARRLRELDW